MIGQLSNQNTFSQIMRLHDLVTGRKRREQEERKSEQAHIVVAGRVRKRLSPKEEAELIAAYRGGEAVTPLATRFQIHHSTVSKLLKRRGISRSARTLNSIQVSRAIELYQNGLSLARVADQLHCCAGTIRNALESAGVVRRDSHGRPKKGHS
jgi:DNA-directed RNA polymerase specialized sigma24 family protein